MTLPPRSPLQAAGTSDGSAWMLDADEAIARVRRSGVDVDAMVPTYLRDKPGESLVVGYDLHAGRARAVGYVRWCADSERAAAEWHKALSIGTVETELGSGVVRVDDRSVLRILPNDARLRSARWYLSPRKLKRSLPDLDGHARSLSGSATSVRLLTYKPERRFVARVDLGYRDGHRLPVVVRYTATPGASRLQATARHLRANGVTTARSMVCIEGGRVAVDELLSGVELRTAAQVVTTRPVLAARVAAAVVEQLFALHRVPAQAVMPDRSRGDEVAIAGAALRWLCGRGEVDTRLARSLWQRMGVAADRIPAGVASVIHGDLHDRNVLVDLDGDPSAALIDLERVAVGEAALDLGYLAAHGIAGAIRRDDAAAHSMTASIVAHTAARESVDAGAVSLYTTTGLVAAALTAARHLEPLRRPDIVPRLIETALAQCPRQAELPVDRQRARANRGRPEARQAGPT